MMVKQCQGDVHAHTHRAHVPLTVQSHGNITCATKIGVQYLNLGVPIQVSMRCAWLWNNGNERTEETQLFRAYIIQIKQMKSQRRIHT
jgi:hypothetical protein